MQTSHLTAQRTQVVAFRLESHHLGTRLPGGTILTGAGACGLQNTPPGTAALALCARIDPLTPGEFEAALVKDKTLLQAWSLRSSPFTFPTYDAPIFTLGLLPADEAAMRFFIFGVEPALSKVGMNATELVRLAASALQIELNGKAMTKDELGIRLARRIAQELPAHQRSGWELPSWYSIEQSLGESMVRFALPILSLQGLCCHGERIGKKASIKLTSQWLNDPLPPAELEQAQAGLVRRYLHCYGPSTLKHFAEWAGISPHQAERAWQRVVPEMVPILFNSQEVWLLQRDLANFLAPPAPAGVRFLPPHDPYLQLRDRDTLVAERDIQRQIWRQFGNPGVILVDGEFAGMWRPRKQGRRLKISATCTRPMEPDLHQAMVTEAERLLPFRDCTSMDFVSASFEHER